MQKNFLFKAWAVALMIVIAGTANADTWTRVTTVDDLKAGGTCIIGYEATANSGVIVPMQNTGTATATKGGYLYSGTTANATGNGTITMATVATTSMYEVTIAQGTTTGTITIKCGDNYIVPSPSTGTSASNKLKLGTEAYSAQFTPTLDDNGNFKLTCSQGSLQYNKSSKSERFTIYDKSGQQNVVIYKKTTGSTTPSGKTTATLSFPETSYTTYVGEVFDLPTATTNSDATITYSMETNSAYDFDAARHQFLCETVGTYTLTASIAENESYTAATATTTINVVNKPTTTYYQKVTSATDIVDGGEYLIVNPAGTKALASPNASKNRFNTADVTVTNDIITTTVNADNVPYTVTLQAEGTKYRLNLYDGQSLENTTSSNYLHAATITGTPAAGQLWTITFDATTSKVSMTDDYTTTHVICYNSKLTDANAPWATYAKETTDQLLPYLYKKVTPYDYTRTVVSGDYGTICLPSSVAADARTGATFYTVSGVADNHTTLQLTEETGALEAGKPYVFLASAGEITCNYTAGTAVTAPVANGLLVGTFSDITVSAANSFVLQKQDGVMGFYKVEDVQPTLGANRAYLVYDAPAGVKGLTFGTATGLQRVETRTPGAVYNLQGQRVSHATKGIFIINGKKVIK